MLPTDVPLREVLNNGSRIDGVFRGDHGGGGVLGWLHRDEALEYTSLEPGGGSMPN